jgi:APA family basic amino acid/polyamine antiporter
VATTTAILVSVPIDTLSTSAAPLSLVFQAAPDSVKQAFAVIVVIATVNGVLIQMIMASRVLYGLADRGRLPAALAKISRRTNTPVIATITVALIIALLAQTLPINALAEHTSQIVLIVFVVVNAALIRLKWSARDTKGYFKVPILVPIMGVVTCVLLLGTTFL